MYITTCKIDDQCKFDANSKAHKAYALVQPRGMGGEGWSRGVKDGGTYVYLCLIQVDEWQSHHDIVK